MLSPWLKLGNAANLHRQQNIISVRSGHRSTHRQTQVKRVRVEQVIAQQGREEETKGSKKQKSLLTDI